MKIAKSPYDKISKLNRLHNSFLDDLSRNLFLVQFGSHNA